MTTASSSPDNSLLDFVLKHPDFRKNRLPSLYSDYTPLSATNPSGYTANTTAWTSVLTSATSSGLFPPNRLSFTLTPSLLTSLTHPQWGRPLALGLAIEEAVASKDFWPYKDFTTRQTSLYHWTYLGAAFGWGLKLVGLSKKPSNSPTKPPTGQRYVVIKNVDTLARSIIAKVGTLEQTGGGKATLVFTKALFERELTPGITSDDLTVLLKYITRDLGAAVWDQKRDVIKFAPQHASAATPVDEQDTTIASLRTLHSTLTSRTAVLSATISTCQEKAKRAVAAGNKPLAMSLLKSRTIASGALTKTLDSAQQVETVMGAIEQAATNIEFVAVMERSSKVLQGLNKEIGGAERVDKVMDGLREEIVGVDEVTGIIGEGAGGEVVDEGEVEEELERMLREVKEEKKVEAVPVVKEPEVQVDKEEKEVEKELKELSIEDLPSVPKEGPVGEQKKEEEKDQQQVPA